jgi:RecA/RadA recombinase
VTREENMLLLMCLVRYDDLLVEAMNKVGDHPLFDNLSDPCSTFIWQVLRDCRTSANSFPPRLMVEIEAQGRLENTLGFEDSFREDVKQMLEVIYSVGPEHTSIEVGRSFLTIALQQAIKGGWADRVHQINTMEEMRKYVNDLSADMATMSTDGSALDKPLLNPENFLVKKIRAPFGVRVLDLITGGGLAPGEVIGLLGPTGGGKTVFAINMLCEKAKRYKHSMLISYEEETEGDIMERICAFMTGISIDQFRDKEINELPSEIREKLDEQKADYGKYLTVVDLAKGTRGSGGAEEVMKYVEQQVEAGEAPELVIIDWLGAMVERYIAFNGMSNDDYRHVATTFIDKICMHAKQFGYSVIIEHQLNTTKARASHQSKPVATDAHEFRAFSFKMDGCICLGTLDPETKVGWLCMSKFRRGGVSDLMVILNGEHVRFDQAEGYVTDHRGRFIEEDAMPDVDEELSNRATGINEDLANAYST